MTNCKLHRVQTTQSQGTILFGGSHYWCTAYCTGRTVHEDSGAYSHDLQSDHAGRSSHTRKTVASLPSWHTDYTCHHFHSLNEPAAKDGVWNWLLWLAHSHAQSLATNFSRSTALGMPESEWMNGQRDWQAQKTSILRCKQQYPVSDNKAYSMTNFPTIGKLYINQFLTTVWIQHAALPSVWQNTKHNIFSHTDPPAHI